MQSEFVSLLSVSEEERNPKWEEAFFQSFPKAKIDLIYPEPRQGPDSWPYMYVSCTEDSKEPAETVLHWLSRRGIGLVVNPDKDLPDYVLPFGMIWYFQETGRFLSEHIQFRGQSLVLEEGKQYYSGEPSKAYIPDYVRKVVREFLQQQSVLMPKVCMLSSDNQHWDLCFSLDSLGMPPQKEHAGIAEALSWFFPQHYSIVLLKEQKFLNFFNL